MLPKKDVVRLRHMLEFAQQTRAFIEGRAREDLDADRMLLYAVVRGLEIIGEAASQVSQETRTACPMLPWRVMVDTRNRLIHAYFDLSFDTIWEVVRDDLPPLIADLEAILGEP